MSDNADPYKGFNNYLIETTEQSLILHRKYNASNQAAINTCQEIIRQIGLANIREEDRKIPAEEYWRDLHNAKDLIYNRNESFIFDSNNVQRKEFGDARLGPIWKKLTQQERDDMWIRFKRIYNMARKIATAC